jgi:hypothetical protein
MITSSNPIDFYSLTRQIKEKPIRQGEQVSPINSVNSCQTLISTSTPLGSSIFINASTVLELLL